MIGDLFASAQADIGTTLGPEAAHLALEAASERATPNRDVPDRLRVRGTFVFRGQARPFSMTAEVMKGQVRLDCAMADHITAHDERDYENFMGAVNHGATYLIENVRDRLARLERILAERSSGQAPPPA